MSQEEIDELKNQINEIINHRYNEYIKIKENYLKNDSKIINDQGFLYKDFKNYILTLKKFKKRKEKKRYKRILNNLDFFYDDKSYYKRCGGDDIELMNETQWKNRLELINELIEYEKQYIFKYNQNKLNILKKTLEESLSNLKDNKSMCYKCNSGITNNMYFCSKCGATLRVI